MFDLGCQVWRLITSFLFFGQLGFSFFFNVIFLYRFCRKLEETNYIGKTADFIVLFIFGIVTTLVSLLMTVQSFVYLYNKTTPLIQPFQTAHLVSRYDH